MTGSWGKVAGDYSVNKIMDQDYVVINSSYFGGGWIERSLNIYSTKDDSFLDSPIDLYRASVNPALVSVLDIF